MLSKMIKVFSNHYSPVNVTFKALSAVAKQNTAA